MSDRTPDRRTFVTGLAAGAAALAAACSTPLAGASPSVTAKPGAAKWDDSWTGRLGKLRTVFDVPDLEGEPGPGVVIPVMDAYHEALGTSDADLGMVLLIRHAAVPMFFSDELWAKYDFGADMKHKDPKTKESFKRNPYKSIVEQAMKRGVTVLGCDTAVKGYAGIAWNKTKDKGGDREAIRQEVYGGIMPGVILQPNGVYALARAQNAGCGFVKGS